MARPDQENAEYFSHDKNMRNDPRIKALRRKFKDGYAVWNMILEVLTDQSNFVLVVNPLVMELLAGDFDIETEELHSIIEYCITIELLCKDAEGRIFSVGHKKRLQPVLDHRNRAKERYLKQKKEKEEVSASETTQSKVKESKVKESKKVVVELEELPEDFSKKNCEDVFIDEDEKYAAVTFLTKHSLFQLIQKNNRLPSEEVINLFGAFYDQKIAFGEMKGKSKDDVVKNFYYWCPKYLQSNNSKVEPKTKDNAGFSNKRNQPGNHAESRQEARAGVVNNLRHLLQGTAPKQ